MPSGPEVVHSHCKQPSRGSMDVSVRDIRDLQADGKISDWATSELCDEVIPTIKKEAT